MGHDIDELLLALASAGSDLGDGCNVDLQLHEAATDEQPLQLLLCVKVLHGGSLGDAVLCEEAAGVVLELPCEVLQLNLNHHMPVVSDIARWSIVVCMGDVLLLGGS